MRYMLLGELQPADKVCWNDKNRREKINNNLKKIVYIYEYIFDEIYRSDI